MHLAISAIVVASVFLTVYFVWYPPPLFGAAGGRDLFVILALVDVVIGPLITLVIYKRGKKGLRFDLAAIGFMQVAALAYGAHVVYEARPAWIVFATDRFDVIRANQVVPQSIAKAPERFRPLSSTGPRLAAARQPDDPRERMAISVTALEGADISSYPELYVDYEEVRREVVAAARPIAELRKFNQGDEAQIDRLARDTGRQESEIAFVPVRAGRNDLTMIVDAKSGETLKLSPLKPWKY